MGLYGVGAAPHLIAQVLVHQGHAVYAFTRPGDEAGQRFARRLGATWAGGSDRSPPEPLDLALIFAPVGRSCLRRYGTSRGAGLSSAAAST